MATKLIKLGCFTTHYLFISFSYETVPDTAFFILPRPDVIFISACVYENKPGYTNSDCSLKLYLQEVFVFIRATVFLRFPN